MRHDVDRTLDVASGAKEDPESPPRRAALPVTRDCMSDQTSDPPLPERASTSVPGLDSLARGGLPVGRTYLVSGGPGTGKTLLALQVLAGAARRGEPGIFVAFEEDSARLRANVASFGWGLEDLMADRRLLFVDADVSDAVLSDHRVDLLGLTARLEGLTEAIGARWVALDGLDVLLQVLPDAGARRREVHRLDRWLHDSGVTGLLSAKADSSDGRLDPDHRFMKSRGVGHSNQVRELTLDDDGIHLRDVYTAGGEVLMGTLRYEKEAEERARRREARRTHERERRRVELEAAGLRAALERLQGQVADRELELKTLQEEARADRRTAARWRRDVGILRDADTGFEAALDASMEDGE
ncbi:MAG: RAD55 family ATPase [Myxococcota bacterium]